MSWADAKSALVTLIEGTTPSTRIRGLPSAFTHNPEQPDEVTVIGRAFRFQIETLRGHGPLTPSTQATRSIYRVALDIDYPADLEPEERDAAIQADYIAIRVRLLDDTYWNRPTSTIELILPGASPDILPAEIIRDDEGARLRIVFDLDFRG